MKEQLTIEHVAPYLPYHLKMKHNQDDYNFGLPIDLTDKFYRMPTEILTNFKPILHPLYDLIGIIGYHFIWDNENDFDDIAQWIDLDNESRLFNKHSYVFWQLLFDNHFDVFNLIEKDLAIDVNTLENNPYGN